MSSPRIRSATLRRQEWVEVLYCLALATQDAQEHDAHEEAGVYDSIRRKLVEQKVVGT